MNNACLVADGVDRSLHFIFFRENLTKSNFKAFPA